MQTELTVPPSDAVERARLEALHRCGLLDTLPESVFDRLTELVAKALRVPVALVSLVDRDRQFFKSQIGLPEPWATQRETPITHSFCRHVASTSEPLVVRDARNNPLVYNNLAIPDIGVISYAGMPLVDEDGFTLGSLCAIDSQPREWSEDDLELLQGLAAQVMTEIALRSKLVTAVEDLGAVREAAKFTVHDLRDPLNALILGLSTFTYLGTANELQRECLDIARRNCDSLRTMIDGLLENSDQDKKSISKLVLEDCTAPALITRAIQQLEGMADPKFIHIGMDLAPGLPVFRADKERLLRVFINLIGNAIKYSNAGSRVQVTGRLTTHKGADFLEFSVADTGTGIPPSAAEHMFSQAVKLNPDGTRPRTTGLGLTYCQRMVEAHGGRIWLSTTLGEGSTFYFTVPVG